MKLQPSTNKMYRPTSDQWHRIINETEFIANESFRWSAIELINFKTSMVHLKGGKRVAFDCLSERQYVWVCNGGYYEEAAEIND